MSHYDDLIERLIAGGFYPAKKLITIGKSTRTEEGLQIDSPSILKDEREKRIREITGPDYSVDWISTHSHFIIKKK